MEFQRMSRLRVCVAAGLATLAFTAGAAAPEATTTHKHYADAPAAAQPGPKGELAPRLQKLGDHTFPASTQNADAQKFVNQGLNLAYAFNHAEARRAFREAARLDPTPRRRSWPTAALTGLI